MPRDFIEQLAEELQEDEERMEYGEAAARWALRLL